MGGADGSRRTSSPRTGSSTSRKADVRSCRRARGTRDHAAERAERANLAQSRVGTRRLVAACPRTGADAVERIDG